MILGYYPNPTLSMWPPALSCLFSSLTAPLDLPPPTPFLSLSILPLSTTLQPPTPPHPQFTLSLFFFFVAKAQLGAGPLPPP